MLKKDLLEKIKNAKDEEDINSLLAGTDIEEQFKGPEPTLDVFKQKIKADKVFQQFMDSERDTYHSKAIKTMKEKGTWESEFGDVLTQKYPDLVTDPTQKKLLDLEKQLAEEKAANVKKDLLAEAMKYANEKGIKLKSIDKYLGEDFDSTKANLDDLAEDWSKGLEAMVNEKMKANSYVPGTGDDGKPISIGASLAAEANKTSTAASDPWAK
ncbi:DUF4355 domain-containing protein [Clostridium beijerinckii]|uniref:DUF4355 domain-containing protein n=1 Tax=Clostridium beijerinckii TaxID=1520 RepID=UPI00098BDCAC|nr:DUF4355 domain-containing protein [Clostridium beijerinckii]MBA8935806.1 hypothetical protein [Clostridium beijerinckii]NRU40200.1 hypothetical protein [Clostridium beijerinckii]NSA96522.1 hypothetical protein [Clostridium beijerinckii]OOM53204.1 hypothetical protein CLOBI_51000 [Clostridium beijerinckii]OOM70339.1 hypothetical protein CLBEIC_20030 [Clostridium beijerinckii]